MLHFDCLNTSKIGDRFYLHKFFVVSASHITKKETQEWVVLEDRYEV